MTVHILVSCRRRELLRASTLVFKSVRTGFPTSSIMVHMNRMDPELHDQIMPHVKAVQPDGILQVDTIHHRWIEQLSIEQESPFWICDTDQIFWSKVEDWNFGTLAGRYIPKWRNEYAGCVEIPRLHTSLMWLDPMAVQTAIAIWKGKFPEQVWTPTINLFRPIVIPMGRGMNLFADCTAMLYSAIGGQRFEPYQMDAYTHLNFGTIEDQVYPRMSDRAQLQEARNRFWLAPEEFKGDWRRQDAYYASRAA